VAGRDCAPRHRRAQALPRDGPVPHRDLRRDLRSAPRRPRARIRNTASSEGASFTNGSKTTARFSMRWPAGPWASTGSMSPSRVAVTRTPVAQPGITRNASIGKWWRKCH
jgi:hypothetical protein